ncbi:MAG: response regulator [Actinomycetota bacterium]
MQVKTILHIEDSAVEREIIRQVLEAEGFEVISSSEPVEGIELARRRVPHLILVDLHLPDMDGYKTVKNLRKLPQLDQVPIVALSASVSEEEKRKCRDFFDGFLDKPIDDENFPGLVLDLISRGREYPRSTDGAPEGMKRGAAELSKETREALEALEKVRAAMSHDLRTPLTVMISYANTVGREKVGGLNEKQKEMLDMVVDHGFQMDTLISELVRIAKDTLDRFEYPPKKKAPEE